MSMKNEFNTLLQKEMDRKAFLKHVGVGFAVIIGAATLLKTLNNFGGSPATGFGAGPAATSGMAGFGYGADAYGGAEVSRQMVQRGAYS